MSAPYRFKIAGINNSGVSDVAGSIKLRGKKIDPSTGLLVEVGTEHVLTVTTNQGQGVANADIHAEIAEGAVEYEGWLDFSAGTGTNLYEVRLLISTDGGTTYPAAGEGHLLFAGKVTDIVSATAETSVQFTI